MREISRDEYRKMQNCGYAGTVRTLSPEIFSRWGETCPGWLGRHWGMFSEREGLTLQPVNVVKGGEGAR